MPDAGRTREPCVQRRVHLCARKQRQVQPKHRHSLRNGLRLIRGLLGAPGFLATVARRFVACELDPSIGGSGQRDFAVRIERVRLARRHVHRIPPPTFVTIAKRPSSSERDGSRQS
jgi:hypothetical protein